MNDGNENFTELLLSGTYNRAALVGIEDVDVDGDLDVFAANRFDERFSIFFNITPVGISPLPPQSPGKIDLVSNYPNPFNPTTTITFTLSEAAFASVHIYNIQGQLIRTLVEKRLNNGKHEIDFDAENLSSGIYLYQITAGNVKLTKKMILLQ